MRLSCAGIGLLRVAINAKGKRTYKPRLSGPHTARRPENVKSFDQLNSE